MSKQVHLMVDIESLGTAKDSVIVSVGAASFEIETGKILEEKYWELQLGVQQELLGRTIDSSTIMWWMQQSKQCQQAVYNTKRTPINEFLEEFSQLCQSKTRYWAKSTNFDFEILKDLYTNCNKAKYYGINWPMQYSKYADARVMYYLGKQFGIMPKDKNNFAHNALADCKYQIKVVSEVYKKLKFGEFLIC